MKAARLASVVLCGLVLSAVARDAVADSPWSPAAAMPRGFAFHTATRLKDGTVVVAGGATDADLTASYADAARFDPTANAWTTLPMMASARAYHAAIVLPSGKLWVSGGLSTPLGGPTATELFDPAAGTWSAGPSLSTSRVGHTASLLPDGKVLVVGGMTGDATGLRLLSTTEIYDPATNALTAGPSTTQGHGFHTATTLPNGKILVAGGGTPTSGAAAATTNSAEIYDPATGKWAQETMPHARYGHTATWMPSGGVLLAGGVGTTVVIDDVDVYGAIGFWSSAGAMHAKRSFHSAEALPSGRVLVAGGIDGVTIHSTAEVYDPASKAWLATDVMPAARGATGSVTLADGRVLITGGLGETAAPSTTAWLFKPLAAGASCANAGSCASGFCVDGVCCDAACDGQCSACDVAGSAGKCTAVTGQPHGARAKCQPYVCGATACLTACKDGNDCAAGYSCDATGACVPRPTTCSSDGLSQVTKDGTKKDCAPYRCDEATGACSPHCSTTSDCTAGASCDSNGSCISPVSGGDGGGCAVPGEGSTRAPWALLAAAGAIAVAVGVRRRRR